MSIFDLKLPQFPLANGEAQRFLNAEPLLAEISALSLKLREARRSGQGSVESWLKEIEQHHPETRPYFGLKQGLPALFDLENAARLRQLVGSPDGQIVLLLLCRDLYYLLRRVSKEQRRDLEGDVLEFTFTIGCIFARLALLPGLDRAMISVHDHSATWTDDHPLVPGG